MFPKTHKWFEQRSWHRQALKLIKGDPEGAACDAMFALNTYARNSSMKRSHPVSTIYTLKNDLMRYLYLQGACVGVTLNQQELECWECGGERQTRWTWYGEEVGKLSDCWKCHGTGVYRTIPLYEFLFVVNNRFYRWHCPVHLWMSKLVVPPTMGITFQGLIKGGGYTPKPEEVEVYIEIVRQFLGLVHVYNNCPEPSLWYAIKQDLNEARIRYLWKLSPYNLSRLRWRIVNAFNHRFHLDSYIPF